MSSSWLWLYEQCSFRHIAGTVVAQMRIPSYPEMMERLGRGACTLLDPPPPPTSHPYK